MAWQMAWIWLVKGRPADLSLWQYGSSRQVQPHPVTTLFMCMCMQYDGVGIFKLGCMAFIYLWLLTPDASREGFCHTMHYANVTQQQTLTFSSLLDILVLGVITRIFNLIGNPTQTSHKTTCMHSIILQQQAECTQCKACASHQSIVVHL